MQFCINQYSNVSPSMISQPKSRKSLVFLTILLLPVKIRKPVFISVKHLSVLGAPGGCNPSVPSSSLGWPQLRFSFVTMITWFSYQINCIITCCRSDVDDFLIIFIVHIYCFICYFSISSANLKLSLYFCCILAKILSITSVTVIKAPTRV